MQISAVSLALIWPSSLCLPRVLCTMLLLQAFPFPSTPGEVTLHLLSQACMFIYSSCGKRVFPPLLWSFPPTTAFTSFLTTDCWAVLLLLPASVFVYSSRGRWVFPLSCGVFLPLSLSQAFLLLVTGCTPLLLPSPARPGLFIYSSRGIPLPLCSTLRVPLPLCNVSYCSYCLLFSFCFFPGWGSVCPGAMLIWPRDVCGSTTYHLAHFVVHIFPSHLGAGDWLWPGGPPGFSVQHEVRCFAQAGGVEGSTFCLFSVALPARCVSNVSPRFHFRRHAFCFLLLATIFTNS
jgi:hypothetical protein